jgi:hypothetical protein
LKTANNWWLRSPNLNNTNNVLYVNTSGDWNNNNYNNTYGVRPALVELRGRVTRTTGESRAPTIKGNHILSRPNGGDEHITPRLAHPPAGWQRAAERKRAGVWNDRCGELPLPTPVRGRKA